MNITISSPQHVQQAAQRLTEQIGNAHVIAFHGEMGAGKTTLIKALCQEYGSQDTITSPTFAIVNEYTDANGTPIYHFDFYRVKNVQEAMDMGCEDYFYSGNLCLIEWPELIEELLPPDTLRVTISVREDGSREILL